MRPPTIPEQPPVQEEEKAAKQPSLPEDATSARKRTASAAELDVPEFKKTKVDANGAILLDDSDDEDDLVLL